MQELLNGQERVVKMGEIRQTNFRIDQQTADEFRKFCEENGLNQAQGFDHIMQVVELDRAKTAAPARLTEIEGFEKSVKDIMAAYLYSIEINQNAEGRIREQFASDLDRKDKTIDDLRTKTEQLQAEKNAAEEAAAEAVKAKNQAEKDAAAAEKVRVAAEKTAEDKAVIADTLAVKLAETEKKAEGFDELQAALAASQDALKAAEQRLKDARRDAAEDEKDAARQAEKEKEQAVKEISDQLRGQIAELQEELRAAIDSAKDAAREAEREKDRAIKAVSDDAQTRITELQEELRLAKSEADAARREAETAKTAAIAELSQAHAVEVAGIRAKLDARVEELLQARQHIADLERRK